MNTYSVPTPSLSQTICTSEKGVTVYGNLDGNVVKLLATFFTTASIVYFQEYNSVEILAHLHELEALAKALKMENGKFWDYDITTQFARLTIPTFMLGI
jgi:hypothetical protein